MIAKYFNTEFIKMLQTDTDGPERVKAYTEISASNFKGYIEKMSAYQRSLESRRKYSASHTLMCDVSVTLSRGQRIKAVTSGTYYDILDIDVLMNHHQEIELAEVTN